MPKYTKVLPQDEFEKLTLDEKAKYLIGITELLKPRIVRPDSPSELAADIHPDSQPDANPPLDDKPKLP